MKKTLSFSSKSDRCIISSFLLSCCEETALAEEENFANLLHKTKASLEGLLYGNQGLKPGLKDDTPTPQQHPVLIGSKLDVVHETSMQLHCATSIV